MTAKKKYTFPRWAKILDKDGEQLVYSVCQVYKVGIYVATYHKGYSTPKQFNLTPGQAIKHFKQFRTENLTAESLADGYTVETGLDVTVTEIDGLWEEVKEEVVS